MAGKGEGQELSQKQPIKWGESVNSYIRECELRAKIAGCLADDLKLFADLDFATKIQCKRIIGKTGGSFSFFFCK